MPFENNAICAKLSLPTISFESKATEDPGESLESKSLNWIMLNKSKRTQSNKMKRSTLELQKDKEWGKKNLKWWWKYCFKEIWRIKKRNGFLGKEKRKMAQKVGYGREQDKIKDAKKWWKILSSEESYRALKFVCISDAGKIHIFILLIIVNF